MKNHMLCYLSFVSVVFSVLSLYAPALSQTDAQPSATAQSASDGMVLVPGGEFAMGCNESVDSECEDDEKPQRQVSVPTFQIDRTEVTVEAYRQCVNARGCSTPQADTTGRGSCNWPLSGREKHPINCINWNQAEAYCAWVRKRLPTEVEWEKAARGTEGRVYPSGESWDITKANVAEAYDGFKDTAPVGSFPEGASPYGALDMAGNVWEWTADWYRNGETRMLRGGSWVDLPRRARTSRRLGSRPDSVLDDVGVRCAR
ncbi:MAG: formylglycine-generating enzyme family protein [Deltaproteobacteria bacterium]|nr:formylglycine-generating enzyme family protein [Deltaproteobacteria bacterium]